MNDKSERGAPWPRRERVKRLRARVSPGRHNKVLPPALRRHQTRRGVVLAQGRPSVGVDVGAGQAPTAPQSGCPGGVMCVREADARTLLSEGRRRAGGEMERRLKTHGNLTCYLRELLLLTEGHSISPHESFKTPLQRADSV